MTNTQPTAVIATTTLNYDLVATMQTRLYQSGLEDRSFTKEELLKEIRSVHFFTPGACEVAALTLEDLGFIIRTDNGEYNVNTSFESVLEEKYMDPLKARQEIRRTPGYYETLLKKVKLLLDPKFTYGRKWIVNSLSGYGFDYSPDTAEFIVDFLIEERHLVLKEGARGYMFSEKGKA